MPTGPTLADLKLSREAGRGPQDLKSVFHMRRQAAAVVAV